MRVYILALIIAILGGTFANPQRGVAGASVPLQLKPQTQNPQSLLKPQSPLPQNPPSHLLMMMTHQMTALTTQLEEIQR